MKMDRYDIFKCMAILVILGYIALSVVFAPRAFSFLTHTSKSFEAPKGTIIRQTSEVVAKRLYWGQIVWHDVYVLIEAPPGGTVIDEGVKQFTNQLLYSEYAGEIFYVVGYYTDPRFPEVSPTEYLGPGNTSTIVYINFGDEKVLHKFVDSVEMLRKAVIPTFTAQCTSVMQMSDDLKHDVTHDVEKIDIVSIPVAFIALAVCVYSIRQLTLPLIVLPVSIIVTLRICKAISHSMKFVSVAPEMMSATIIALGIDYSLFILCRFNEKVEMFRITDMTGAKLHWNVVKHTSISAAHNTITSGVAVAVAYGGMAFIPVDFVRSFGVGCSLGVVVTVIVSLTLGPCILFVLYPALVWMPNWMKRLADRYNKWRFCEGKEDGDEVNNEKSGLLGDSKRASRSGSMHVSVNQTGDDNVPINVPSFHGLRRHSSARADAALDAYCQLQRTKQYRSIWFKVGRLAYRRPWAVLAGLTLALLPSIALLTRFTYDDNLYAAVPTTATATKTFEKIGDMFGPLTSSAFYLVFSTDSYEDCVTGPQIDLANRMLRDVNELYGIPLEDIISPTKVNGTFLPLDELNKIQNEQFVTDTTAVTSDADQLQYATAFTSNIYYPAGPWLSRGSVFFDPLSRLCERYKPEAARIGLNLGLVGPDGPTWAIMAISLQYMPKIIGFTCGVIVLTSMIAFRSVFISIRMVATMAYTVTMAFGAGVAIYQLDWLHGIFTSLKNIQALFWLVPPIVFPLLCALALDYDVFLLTRVSQLRFAGFDDEAAIAKGVWRSGRVISFAGIIMTVAFGTLMLTSCVMLKMFGTLCAIAVLCDCFVVRPLMVPALMAVAKQYTWWPRVMPTPRFYIDDMIEHQSDVAALSPSATYSEFPEVSDTLESSTEQSPEEEETTSEK